MYHYTVTTQAVSLPPCGIMLCSLVTENIKAYLTLGPYNIKVEETTHNLPPTMILLDSGAPGDQVRGWPHELRGRKNTRPSFWWRGLITYS